MIFSLHETGESINGTVSHVAAVSESHNAMSANVIDICTKHAAAEDR